MILVRLAALAACLAALTSLSACAPAPEPSAPSVSLPTTAMPVAPSLTALAPGSPLATYAAASPSPIPTPTATSTRTSPLKTEVLGWRAFSQRDDGVAVQVSYAKGGDRSRTILASAYPTPKNQAQIEKAFPAGKRYGSAWCVPDDTKVKTFTCFQKVGGGVAVLALGPQGLSAPELARVTEALASGL